MDHSPTPTVALPVEPWRVAGSRAVHPSRCTGTEPLVAAIAEGLAAVAVPWDMATGESPEERRYELILSTDAYDAWLIHWPAGSCLGAHDHGGSAGAFAVVAGAVEEHTVVDGLDVARRLAAGQSVGFGRDHVHAVSNPTDTAATSVHVYAPPLRSMGFYRADGGAVVLERVDEIGNDSVG